MQNENKNSIWIWLLAITTVAIWAETFVSSKVLLNVGLQPADIFFYRFLLAHIGILFVSHRQLWANSWRDEGLMALLGITGGSLYFLLENMAIRYSTANNVAILIGTTPMITALLLAAFYPDERMSRRQVFGSMVAFIGLILVVMNGQLVLHLNPLGDMLALLSALIWGVYSLLLKIVSPRYDTGFLTRKCFGYGLITILIWFVAVEPLNTNLSLLTTPMIAGNLLWLSLVASLGCYLAWNWVLPRLGVVRSTNILYTQSAFTMAISAAVLGEQITWMAILGMLILVAGQLIITRMK